MKAIRIHQFGPPEVMRLEEVDDPIAAAGQVVVRVHSVGVNPVETYIRSGSYARKPELPFTPGNDGAGVVESVGAGVSRVRPGDRVYTSATTSGSYAEKTLCAEANVHPLAESVSFDQGAAVNIPYATAYRGLFQRAHALPGETVLVHGASGGVGVAALQIARAAGFVVIGTAGTDRGLELIAREGAHHALNHREEGYLEKLMSLTGGRGVDVILEMLSNVNLAKDLQSLAFGGRVVVIGCRGTIEINPRDTMSRDAAILGMSLYNASAGELASVHAALVAGLQNGTLRPVVGQRMPLADAPRAHVAVMEAGAYGKIVLET